MFGRQAVIGNQGVGLRGFRDPPGQVSVRRRGADGVAAAMQVEHGMPGNPVFWGDEFAGDSFGDHLLRIHPIGEEPGPVDDLAKPFAGFLHRVPVGKAGEKEAHDALEETAAKAGHE